MKTKMLISCAVIAPDLHLCYDMTYKQKSGFLMTRLSLYCNKFMGFMLKISSMHFSFNGAMDNWRLSGAKFLAFS